MAVMNDNEQGSIYSDSTTDNYFLRLKVKKKTKIAYIQYLCAFV